MTSFLVMVSTALLTATTYFLFRFGGSLLWFLLPVVPLLTAIVLHKRKIVYKKTDNRVVWL